jgi:phytoene dehydrogenase-like protein
VANPFDAVVVGAGPNGLGAAITLQREGLSVLLVEARESVGGGMRTAELTLPGFLHDVCSAVHPMAKASPLFGMLPLHQHGLTMVVPPVQAAHPFDDGTAACLCSSLEQTAASLGQDEETYFKIFEPLVKDWSAMIPDILAPLRIPRNPIKLARFGVQALLPANTFARRFHTKHARGLFAGMAAHSMQPFSRAATTAIALVLSAAGHAGGWPIPMAGSRSLANALTSYFESIGGKVEVGQRVKSLKELPPSRAVLLDLTPRQLLKIAGEQFSSLYRWQLERYRYGMGVFKVDWALHEPVPFTAQGCRQAGTVHIGGTFEEIAESEDAAMRGQHLKKPFVLLAQPSLFDPSRAPEGKHTLWGYCHVPNGSRVDMTDRIEEQIERFAPGFRDTVIARHTMNTQDFESYNQNYVGGDINGGEIDLRQLYTRPAIQISPYRTSLKSVYICSSSTPPGGGVHGMCGYHAARQALHDVFGITKPSL